MLRKILSFIISDIHTYYFIYSMINVDNQPILKVIGNYSYQLDRCLGEGAFGKVYEGVCSINQRKVAIKKIDLKILENNEYLKKAINSQISILQRFKHENIVQFIDFLASKNSLYLIMEFCEQGDLKRYLKKNKNLTEQKVFQILKQIIEGFYQLHKYKIIHRDLKPANILISKGVFKIADFGFAKYVDNYNTQILKSCVGSPIYMSPQILGRSAYTTKCDIWSLGIILYQMLYSQLPWTGYNEAQLFSNIKNKEIKIKKQGQFSKIIRKMLQYQEENRIDWSNLFEWVGLQKKQNDKIKSPMSKSMKKIQIMKESNLDEVRLLVYIFMDFFSKIKLLKKMSNNHQILQNILSLISQILEKKYEMIRDQCIKFQLNSLCSDISDYLKIHGKYLIKKQENKKELKIQSIILGITSLIQEFQKLQNNKFLTIELIKLKKYCHAFNQKKSIIQIISELRSTD